MFRGRYILEGRSATTTGLNLCADTIIGSLFGRLVPLGSVESLTVAIINQRSICSSMCNSSYIRVLRCLHTSMRVMAKCRLVSNRPLSASEGIWHLDLAFVNPGFSESGTLPVLGIFLAILPFIVHGFWAFMPVLWWLTTLIYWYNKRHMQCRPSFRAGDCGSYRLRNLSFPFHDDELLNEDDWWPWLKLLSAFAVNYGITAAIFSNWILAAIAIDNWSGRPSSNSAYTLFRTNMIHH